MISGKAKKPANCLAPIWQATLLDHVIGLDYSADGTLLVAASISGPISVFEVETGKLKHELKGHRFGTAAIECHPNSPTLASCGQDGSARVWNLETGGETLDLSGGSAWVEHVAWNGDGTLLATAAGKIVALRDWPSGRSMVEYPGHPSTVADLAWEPGTGRLSVAVYGGVFHYNPTEADADEHYEWKGSPLKLAWSPDGKMLAHGNQDASVHFWYSDDSRELNMSGYPGKVRELSWDFRSRYLATGGGTAVCIWDCSGAGPEGSLPNMLAGQGGVVSAVMWQRRGTLLASGDLDGRVCLWQPANRTPLIGGATFEGTEISALTWSRDDKQIAIGSGAGLVGVFRVM